MLARGAEHWFLRGTAGLQTIAAGHNPVAALATVDGETLPAGARLAVSIADAHLRYLAVAPPAALRGRAERMAWLAHRFREVHGVAEPEWMLLAEPELALRASLACAAPRALVEGMRAFAQGRRLRLTGIEGAFVASYNRLRGAMTARFGAFARLADGRLSVGLWRDGQWLGFRSQPVSAGDDAALLRILLGWRALWPEEEGGVLYAAADAGALPPGWRLESVLSAATELERAA
jgi:hypothetical protein